MRLTRQQIVEMATGCGFELAGVVAVSPSPDFDRYQSWIDAGMAGEMAYLTDHRAALRADPRTLLPEARTLVVVGQLYNTPHPSGPISRYAWGDDYHDRMRDALGHLRDRLAACAGPFASRICVDTAPLLERSWARAAGLGWIGKNTCLIHQGQGSWFFLGELLLSLEVDAAAAPPPDRCGTCTRCIDACPTQALTPYRLDARRCISYFTIELRGPIPEPQRPGIGQLAFGCDICQDVCPWNRKAPVTTDPAYAPRARDLDLPALAALSEDEFRQSFRGSPVRRARYTAWLRNLAIAMGNAGDPRHREPLRRLAAHPDPLVADAARWALDRLPTPTGQPQSCTPESPGR